MENTNTIKITYHTNGKKINSYWSCSASKIPNFKKSVEDFLFVERLQPRCEIRIFWIDDDQDEIEILGENDVKYLFEKSGRQHLHVAPIGEANDAPSAGTNAAATTAPKPTASETITETATNKAQVPPAVGSYDFAVHDRVECDACLMAPIIGFRYKCIQCPNYDLCQNCEAKHTHSEHMMVRMPTNNCPNVIEAYVTGRNTRRHGNKRSKTSCPFVMNGLSVVIDDEQETNGATAAAGAGGENAANANKEQRHGRKHHRRHHRNNFFSHLYEMMHDLAEGGGAAAAAHAMGESATTSNTTSTTTGPQTTSTTTTTASNIPLYVSTAATAPAATAAAFIAAQHAHEAATKAAEIASKVAHETAVQAAHNISVNMTAVPNTTAATAPSSSSATSAGVAAGEKETEATKAKIDATTSPRAAEPQQTNPGTPIVPSPTLESLAQFLDPQYMKTGIQILNNFSDMFAKMLDPMDNNEAAGGDNENQLYPNLRKNSTTSTKSSVSSHLSSLGSDKKTDKVNEKPEQTKDTEKLTESDISSQIEIDDLGSDSESDSVSESFIKLDAPKEATPSSSQAKSAQSTPPQSLDKSKTMDFAQLSADLKAHIAQESAKTSTTSIEIDAAVDATATDSANKISTNTTEPVVTSTTTSTTASSSSYSSTNTASANPEEKRAVPVYHADPRINNSVLAMMAMGFSNEGAWLTQLLESVNGNIPEALDLMPVAQRSFTR